MPVIYRPSRDQEVIVLARPIDTVTTIQAYGSADGYTTPETWFGTDETIMVAGDVTAGDRADLSRASVEIYLNGVYVGAAGLSFDPAIGSNYYQFSLGMLAEGQYTVEAVFRRLRVP